VRLLSLVALLVGLALAAAGAVLLRGQDTVVPLFDDRVLGLLLGAAGLLVALVALVASFADRAGEDDPVVRDALLR
jgi:hypothetical protein